MDTFNANEYSEKSREVLKKVVEEIREQFLVGGSLRQFWFYTVRIPDKTLTEPIIQKWFEVLSSKGILHYYKLDYSELGQATTFERRYLEKDYNWEPSLITQFILGFPPHLAPSFVLDIYDTDLDKLIRQLQKDRVWGKFQKDLLDRYSYDGTLLIGINNSPLRKAVLEEFLLANEHTVSAKRVEEIISQFSSREVDDHVRSDTISETKKALREVSHEIDIASSKAKHKVDYYQLVINKQSV